LLMPLFAIELKLMWKETASSLNTMNTSSAKVNYLQNNR